MTTQNLIHVEIQSSAQKMQARLKLKLQSCAEVLERTADKSKGVKCRPLDTERQDVSNWLLHQILSGELAYKNLPMHRTADQ